MKLLNAFSLSMLPMEDRDEGQLLVERVKLFWVQDKLASLGIESFVGHADTAKMFSEYLILDVAVRRESVTLLPGEVAIVGQYNGPRLPEGTTKLPVGAEIRWYTICYRNIRETPRMGELTALPM